MSESTGGQQSIKKKANIFFDGQNLYRSAKTAFGYNYPNYDIKLLSERVCMIKDWDLTGIYFYTGVPDPQDNPFWHGFWSRKIAHMGRLGINIFTGKLRYNNEAFRCPSCNAEYTSLVGHEKGVDVQIALDIIRLAHDQKFDIAVIFSQDQDLAGLVDQVRMIANEKHHLMKVLSAFPVSPTVRNSRGIKGMEWMKIDKATYDSCIDPTDYRNPPNSPSP